MSAWQPRRGERVIAVLPDGHEIEGEYGFYNAPIGLLHVPGYMSVHIVFVGDVGEPDLSKRERVYVRTVKPLPVPEPTAHLARIIDGDGVRRYRASGDWWCDIACVADPRRWDKLPQPVTVIDANPNWEPAPQPRTEE